MGDMGEYWNDYKEYVKERKAQSLAEANARFDELSNFLAPYGLVLLKRTEYHWQILDKTTRENILEMWPSTRKYAPGGRRKTKSKVGGIDEIKKWVQNAYDA